MNTELLDEIVDLVSESTGARPLVDTSMGGVPAYRLEGRAAAVRLAATVDDQIDLLVLADGCRTRTAEFHHMPAAVVAAAVIRILL